jgi:hypothetical protein
MRSTPSRSIIDIENLQHFSDTLTIIPIRRVARGARCQRRVDRNSFRSPCGECDTGSVQPPCRARRPLPAEGRPKFISVALWGVRFRECSTSVSREAPAASGG